MGKTQYVFIRDPEYAWVPAIKLGGDATKALVKVPSYPTEQKILCDGGAGAKEWTEDEVELKDYNKGVLPMQNVDGSGNLKPYADMVELPFLHEVSVSIARKTKSSHLTATERCRLGTCMVLTPKFLSPLISGSTHQRPPFCTT